MLLATINKSVQHSNFDYEKPGNYGGWSVASANWAMEGVFESEVRATFLGENRVIA